MAQFGAPSLQISASPISPVAASSTSSGGGPAPPPQPVRTGGGWSRARNIRRHAACIPCRRRKVRCDLGSVDDPHDPPCVRCRRESKECYFSATRRKRKVDDGSLDGDADHDDYILRNGRKQMRGTDTPSASTLDRRLYSDVPLTPGGSQGRPQPLRRPGDGPRSARSNSAGEFGIGEPNTPLENFEARAVMRREVYGPQDALDLLYKAATEDTSSHKQDENPAPAKSSSQRSSHHTRQDTEPHRPSTAITPGRYHGRHTSRQKEGPNMEQAIDPELTKRDPSAEPGYNDALKAWGRFRFLLQIPIPPYPHSSPPTIPKPTTSHLDADAVEQRNTILTVTLLTDLALQLWTYLRGMIERVVWGQEAFGGGFCGSGADEIDSSTAPWRGLRRGSLRTLGTIESLMILTEWHPRALHFPPNEVTDELMLPSYESQADDTEGNQKRSVGFGGRRIESWLEPAWRSDRMCWMLLSTGMGLAYELGVFDDIDELLATGAITRPEYEEESYRLRASRIKRLLLIYLSQLAGRLGWTNMVPEKLRKSDPAISKRRRHSVEGTTPGTNPSSLSNAFNYIPDLELDDQIIHCWAGISNAMQVGNDRLFRSRKHTTEIIQSGKYIELLKDFQPMLKEWWNQFERFRMPPYIRHVLTIEYEYVRIYINSLSLQAVVERCTSNAGGGSGTGGSVSGHSGPQLSPQTQNYYGMLPLGRLGGFGAEDQEYVREVVNGSRSLLRTVVEGLLPGDYLKHAPVRTYFRIISGAMFLLKTFALGAPKSDVEMSIGLMDRTVDALRNCVVDDVHLGIRFADMLETLTSRLRNRFIHAPPPPVSTGDGRSPGATHGDGANGSGANGHGLQPHTGNAHDMWSRSRDGPGPERSTTPANISATPWDLTTGTFPYPSGSASMFGPSTPAGTAGMENNGNSGLADNSGVMFDNSDWANPANEMWYLPPGAALFSNLDNTSVSMTAEGVNVGGVDLLEYMAMDPMDPHGFGMDGSGF
ncbi:Transcriptional activator ARO80 [Madurella mycetomatis]|uniref:Transcriptional activator ARO80 n=1 Tax=Madurella mycetomatis TaxID=100816 RepID=A0A175VX85_9PEZI|nr:Transcriptional activator ARO80 [Madurella mycetomatis]